MVLAAVAARDDPRDALAARDGAKLADLPPGARIGTGSPRRAAQLLLLGRDLRPVPVRGNAGTRLAKVDGRRGRRGRARLRRAWPGSAGSTRSARSSSPTRCSRRPARARSRSSAGRTGTDLAGAAGLRGRPGEPGGHDGRTQRARRAAGGLQRPRSARMLPGRMYCGCARLSWQPTGGWRCAASAGGPAAEAERLGREVAAELLRRGAGRYTAMSGGHISNGDDDAVNPTPDKAAARQRRTARQRKRQRRRRPGRLGGRRTRRRGPADRSRRRACSARPTWWWQRPGVSRAGSERPAARRDATVADSDAHRAGPEAADQGGQGRPARGPAVQRRPASCSAMRPPRQRRARRPGCRSRSCRGARGHRGARLRGHPADLRRQRRRPGDPRRRGQPDVRGPGQRW